MKKSIAVAVALIIAAFTFSAFADPQSEAEKIIRQVDDLMRGKTQYAKIKMTVNNPDWPTPYIYNMESWSEGTEKAFIRILSPAKDSGITFLKIGTEMWQYLPKIDRVMKIPPSMMLGSWMGSDFTNDDLVKESSIVDDYTAALTGTETDGVNGEIIIIELKPRPEAAVVWGKLVYKIRQRDMMPLSVDFYDEDSIAIRRMLYEKVKTSGGRTIPTVMRIVPLEEDKKGRETVLEMTDLIWDKSIKPSVFSKRNLKNAG
jgi:outer membrane lipoprotein-sorting protein